ncbi:hypothetical protein DL771_009767 [Monosporascus sp. 5C6A]|nr:hypothetical protein DL771_009767 [Monosporascus sp. 5C6A]
MPPSATKAREVVFFHKEDGITNDWQKELVQRLGELTDKPVTSKPHNHPVSSSSSDQGAGDEEIGVILSAGPKKPKVNRFLQKKRVRARRVSGTRTSPLSLFEQLRPAHTDTNYQKTGDVSGYELYDCIAKPLQGFWDALTLITRNRDLRMPQTRTVIFGYTRCT